MNLYLFNIAVDEIDDSLAANCDFIREAQSRFERVWVFSTHVGRYDFSNNVRVIELGGGTLRNRIRGILRLLQAIKLIRQDKLTKRVLFHMNDRVAAVMSPILRVLGIRTNLWYSHKIPSFALRIANRFVNQVFTTGKSAYPLRHKKVLNVGQLVTSIKFLKLRDIDEISATRFKIVHVGRIAKVKNLETLLMSINNSSTEESVEVTFIGGCHTNGDLELKKRLASIAFEKEIETNWPGPVERAKLPSHLEQFGILFSGTKSAIDKSAIEGAMAGLFIFSENADLLELVGIADFYREHCGNEFTNLETQLRLLMGYRDLDALTKVSNLISETAVKNCGLELNIDKFLANLI